MKKLVVRNLILYLVLLSFFACNGGGGGGPDSPEAITMEGSFKTEVKSSGSTQNGLCYVDQYAPDEKSITRNLDIIIVPDTSVSLKEERGDIAEGFDYFLKTLPSEVDYRIGVILAHSGKSPKSGKLFQRDLEPLVLDSQELTIDEVTFALNEKLKSPAGDGFSDGGEMGLYSLHNALENNLDELKQEGMFRENAALLIIFIADEQDVCFEYPSHIVPVPDQQKKEAKAKAAFCYNDAGELNITPEIVLNKIKEVNGDKPLVIGGVIYNNSATMPINGENEIGYGYKETIELAGGISVDLATADYADGLTRLGNLATASVKPENTFNLKASDIDTTSFNITVDGQEVYYSYLADMNQIQLTEERGEFSVARIEYCRKKEAPLIATQVATGGFHSCALYTDGKVKCWGQNSMGQLGYGNNQSLSDDSDEAVSSLDYLELDEKVIELSAGLFHTCAILESGKIKCWGANSFGQLGLGHTDNMGDNESLASFDKLDFGEKAVHIYSGTFYNCALLESQNVKCWGRNSAGQLGLGHTNSIGDNEDYTTFGYTPIGAKVLQMDISTISDHTCAALVDGNLKCWGSNTFGQLGYGHTNNLGDDEIPADIPSIDFANNILQLATGAQHTCAIEEGQRVRCWGANTFGQLGLGIADKIGDNELANSVAALSISEDMPMKMVATGNGHTCSLGIDNQVYCWGLGSAGALGLGSTHNIGDDEVVSLTNSFVNIADSQFAQISGGISHTCALEKSEGKIICWGDNTHGQLGIASTEKIGDDELPSQFVQLQQ